MKYKAHHILTVKYVYVEEKKHMTNIGKGCKMSFRENEHCMIELMDRVHNSLLTIYLLYLLYICLIIFDILFYLPGGATIRCHFWKRVVFRQSLGESA